MKIACVLHSLLKEIQELMVAIWPSRAYASFWQIEPAFRVGELGQGPNGSKSTKLSASTGLPLSSEQRPKPSRMTGHRDQRDGDHTEQSDHARAEIDCETESVRGRYHAEKKRGDADRHISQQIDCRKHASAMLCRRRAVDRLLESQAAVLPPFTRMIWPVMNAALSEATKTIASAISSGFAPRLSGTET
jgi:hypothetical protein